jgi:hypothetical protein
LPINEERGLFSGSKGTASFGLSAKKLFGGSSAKVAALAGGGGLLAGFLGKQAMSNNNHGQTSQSQAGGYDPSQKNYNTIQQPSSTYDNNQQIQYQQPQQDINTGYGYNQAYQYQQPVQDQAYQPQPGSDYGAYTYADPQQQQQQYYDTSDVGTDSTDYTGYDSYGGDSYANEMYNMNEASELNTETAETIADGGEGVLEVMGDD